MRSMSSVSVMPRRVPDSLMDGVCSPGNPLFQEPENVDDYRCDRSQAIKKPQEVVAGVVAPESHCSGPECDFLAPQKFAAKISVAVLRVKPLLCFKPSGPGALMVQTGFGQVSSQMPRLVGSCVVDDVGHVVRVEGINPIGQKVEFL